MTGRGALSLSDTFIITVIKISIKITFVQMYNICILYYLSMFDNILSLMPINVDAFVVANWFKNFGGGAST